LNIEPCALGSELSFDLFTIDYSLNLELSLKDRAYA
jgi:hypothetical protein